MFSISVLMCHHTYVIMEKKKAFLKILHVEEESYQVLCCLVQSGQEREVFVNTSYWDVWWPFAFHSALHNPL